MKNEVSLWDKLSMTQKAIATLFGVFSTLSTLYGAFTIFYAKNEKIDHAISTEAVIELFDEIKSEVTVLTDEVKDLQLVNATVTQNQAILGTTINDVNVNIATMNSNFTTIKNEFRVHIKKDKGIPEEDKIDDILRIVQGIQTEVKKN